MKYNVGIIYEDFFMWNKFVIINEQKMAVETINSHKELVDKLDKDSRSYVLLYKEGSDQSECALKKCSSCCTG